jgi:four helix bundle protein
MGSASEAEYHILLARDLKLLADDDYTRLASDVVDVKRMLTSLSKKVRTDG